MTFISMTPGGERYDWLIDWFCQQQTRRNETMVNIYLDFQILLPKHILGWAKQAMPEGFVLWQAQGVSICFRFKVPLTLSHFPVKELGGSLKIPYPTKSRHAIVLTHLWESQQWSQKKKDDWARSHPKTLVLICRTHLASKETGRAYLGEPHIHNRTS